MVLDIIKFFVHTHFSQCIVEIRIFIEHQKNYLKNMQLDFKRKQNKKKILQK